MNTSLDTAVTTITREVTNSSYCVVFTGAGISTGSGLPDYRGPQGIWTLRDKGITIPRSRRPWASYTPNQGHYAIADLIERDYFKHLISQNVDGLHLKSGIPMRRMSELHGNSTLMRCDYCSSIYHIDDVGWMRNIHGRGRKEEEPHPNAPVCLSCGGRLISTVVDFGDPLPNHTLQRARTESIRADLFIVLGSSLTVSPASSFPKIAKKHGAKVIIVNHGKTRKDEIADRKYDLDVSILMDKIKNSII